MFSTCCIFRPWWPSAPYQSHIIVNLDKFSIYDHSDVDCKKNIDLCFVVSPPQANILAVWHRQNVFFLVFREVLKGKNMNILRKNIDRKKYIYIYMTILKISKKISKKISIENFDFQNFQKISIELVSTFFLKIFFDRIFSIKNFSTKHFSTTYSDPNFSQDSKNHT